MAAQTLPNRERRTVPDVTLRIRRNGEWAIVTTADIFDGRSVIVFSAARRVHADLLVDAPAALQRARSGVQGARHRPDRVRLCQRSVRDGGVGQGPRCRERAAPSRRQRRVHRSDGLVDKSDLDFGKRSWRYPMLVRDRRIETMFLEPQQPGDPFAVSDADTMLHFLAPNAKLPEQLAILTRERCSFCAQAKKMLSEAAIDDAEIALPQTIRSNALGAIANAETVPQLLVDGRWTPARKRCRDS
jgi:glutaredoxin